jgi:hypothetical protein
MYLFPQRKHVLAQAINLLGIQGMIPYSYRHTWAERLHGNVAVRDNFIVTESGKTPVDPTA